MPVSISLYNHTAKLFADGSNAAADTYKVRLMSAATFNATHTTLAATSGTEVANGNGYTTGGVICTASSSATVNGLYSLVLSDPVAWTASSAGFSFNTIAFYNDTSTNDLILGVLFVSTVGQKSITNIALSANVATLTCNAHGYAVGDVVVVSELDNGVLNGTATITAVTTNTFSFARTAANITSAAVTAGRVIKPETITKAAGTTFAIQFGGNPLFDVKVRGGN